jgi:hypothetical protein
LTAIVSCDPGLHCPFRIFSVRRHLSTGSYNHFPSVQVEYAFGAPACPGKQYSAFFSAHDALETAFSIAVVCDPKTLDSGIQPISQPEHYAPSCAQ